MQLIMMSEVCRMHIQGTYDHSVHACLQEKKKKKKKHKENSSVLPGGKSGTASSKNIIKLSDTSKKCLQRVCKRASDTRAHAQQQLYCADSGSDSEPVSPSHDPNLESAATEAAAAAASLSSAPAAAAGPAVEREDWMTKSFPKAAASVDAVPLPGAKPVDKMVYCWLTSLFLKILLCNPILCVLTGFSYSNGVWYLLTDSILQRSVLPANDSTG